VYAFILFINTFRQYVSINHAAAPTVNKPIPTPASSAQVEVETLITPIVSPCQPISTPASSKLCSSRGLITPIESPCNYLPVIISPLLQALLKYQVEACMRAANRLLLVLPGYCTCHELYPGTARARSITRVQRYYPGTARARSITRVQRVPGVLPGYSTCHFPALRAPISCITQVGACMRAADRFLLLFTIFILLFFSLLLLFIYVGILCNNCKSFYHQFALRKLQQHLCICKVYRIIRFIWDIIALC
jgi:hypothetical protein